VQNILPLATSLLLHVFIIVVGVALYAAVQQVSKTNRDQVIIPQMGTISAMVLPPQIQHPSVFDPLAVPVDDPSGVTPGPDNDPKISPSFETANTGDEETSASPGIGAIRAFDQGKSPAGPGWKVPGNGGLGNGKGTVNFIIPGNAQKVVFLCDASGSMLSVFGQLKQQLRESISNLKLADGQSFNVIFFSNDNAFQLFNDGPQIATDSNKKLAMDFIDSAVATGGTQPLLAIRMAMSQHPELIYLLTDGFDQTADFGQVIRAFKDGNAGGKTHINCIFLQADEDPKLEAVLKEIASDGHGQFKKILKSDM